MPSLDRRGRHDDQGGLVDAAPRQGGDVAGLGGACGVEASLRWGPTQRGRTLSVAALKSIDNAMKNEGRPYGKCLSGQSRLFRGQVGQSPIEPYLA
jgi:hypothetical protein